MTIQFKARFLKLKVNMLGLNMKRQKIGNYKNGQRSLATKGGSELMAFLFKIRSQRTAKPSHCPLFFCNYFLSKIIPNTCAEFCLVISVSIVPKKGKLWDWTFVQSWTFYSLFFTDSVAIILLLLRMIHHIQEQSNTCFQSVKGLPGLFSEASCLQMTF